MDGQKTPEEIIFEQNMALVERMIKYTSIGCLDWQAHKTLVQIRDGLVAGGAEELTPSRALYLAGLYAEFQTYLLSTSLRRMGIMVPPL